MKGAGVGRLSFRPPRGVREESRLCGSRSKLALRTVGLWGLSGSPMVCASWESFRGERWCLVVESEEGSPAVLYSPVTGREGGGDPREATHQGMLLNGSDISEDPVLYSSVQG